MSCRGVSEVTQRHLREKWKAEIKDNEHNSFKEWVVKNDRGKGYEIEC